MATKIENPVIEGDEYVYGIDGTIVGTAIQSADVEDSFANTSTVENEKGNRIARRFDDREKALTLEFKTQKTYALPDIGTKLEWENVRFTVEKVADKRQNKDYRSCTLTCSKLEYID